MAYWLVQSQADVPDDDWWLSDKERSSLAGLRFPKRRNDWQVGRWTAKQATRFYILDTHLFPLDNRSQLRLADLEFFAAPDGAPQPFISGTPADLSLSISHSEHYGFCAVSRGGVALGCDIELIQEHEANFAEDYFGDEEKKLLLQLPGLRKDVALTLIWSGKEAVLKALRQGLRRDTRSVAVSFGRPQSSDDSWNALSVCCLESSRSFGGWWRHYKDFILTIVSDPPEISPIEISRM